MGDFERVKESSSLKEFAEANLEKVRGGYICPTCKSGTGPKKSPAFSIMPNGERWKCFAAGCGASGDIFDLAGAIHHTEDKREQLRIVAEWAGVPLEGESNGGGFKQKRSERKDGAAAPDYTQGRVDEAEKLERWRAELWKHPEAVSYLKGRGFAEEEIRHFGFGYDARKRRVIVPWKGSGYYHCDRDITDEQAVKYLFPEEAIVGPKPLWNPDALEEGLVFIVEGAFDALAVEACGFPAIATGGNTAYRAALDAMASREYTGIAVLMLDSGPGEESKGEKAQADAKKHAETVCHIDCYGADFHFLTGFKDACEALAEDREMLEDYLEIIAKDARESVKAEKREQADDAETLREQEPAEIAAAIFECRGEETPTPTGIQPLDKAMNGGLRSGLFVLGAVSSAGKTTLFVQVCDYIASHGRPVLFVSCEQSGRELVGKSLSRLMAERGYKAVTLWEMGSGKWRARWPQEKETAFSDALAEYTGTIAPNLHIMAGIEQPTVADIRAKAEAIRAARGIAPVIAVDYLQLLKPANDRHSDKQAVDANISDLRRMAWTMRAPVMLISSLNRASYVGEVEMASFKESGGIEYSADLLAALEPYDIAEQVNKPNSNGNPPSDNMRAFRAKHILDRYRKAERRESEIVILKNRTGRIPENPLPITFHAASSLFTDGVGK